MAIVTIETQGYRCERCQHVWKSRGPRMANRAKGYSKGDKPKLCPKCKSPYWEIPKDPPKRRPKKSVSKRAVG